MLTKYINPAILMAAALALGGTAVAQSTGGMKTEPKAQPSPSAQQAPHVTQPAAPVPSKAEAAPLLKSVRMSALDKNQVKDVQQQLKNLGFYKAEPDGVLGAQTRAALLAYFQNQIALTQQGRISDDALTVFGFGKSDIEKVRGIDEAKGPERETTQGREGPVTPQQKEQMKQPQAPQPQQPQPQK